MFTSIGEFMEMWEIEGAATQKFFDVLTDASLQQQVTDQDRTLGRIAWHITTSIPEMMNRTGLTFEGVEEEASVPATAKEIADAYRETSRHFADAVRKNWRDENLPDEKDMYGESWTISKVLLVLVTHQIHHRGQMAVLMRQAGLKVPGTCGPSREEWGQFGMEAPSI